MPWQGCFWSPPACFALRYGISHKLDLKPPLTSVVMDALGWNPPVSAEKAKASAESRMASLLKQLGISVPEPGEKIQPEQSGPRDRLRARYYRRSRYRQLPGQESSRAQTEEASVQGKNGDPVARSGRSASGDQAAPGKGNPEDSMGSKEGPQQGEQQASKSGSAGENSSLLSKLKDALNPRHRDRRAI